MKKVKIFRVIVPKISHSTDFLYNYELVFYVVTIMQSRKCFTFDLGKFIRNYVTVVLSKQIKV